jgi:RecJ-like exonuclease
MSMPTHEELLWRFGKAEDPAIEARRQRLLDFLLETSPQKKQQLIDKGVLEGQLAGRLTEARAALRRVLAGRQLTLRHDDDARIDECIDLPTLERWLDRAITATSVTNVLR